MKHGEYEKKLAQWEAEGYDVSEFRQKWFPRSARPANRMSWRMPAILLSTIFLVTTLVIWQPWQFFNALTPRYSPASSSGNPAGKTGYRLTTHIIPGDGGSIQVSPLPGHDGTYSPGTRVSLEARPSQAYQFSRWSGDTQGVIPSVIVTMSSDMDVTAEFKLVGK